MKAKAPLIVMLLLPALAAPPVATAIPVTDVGAIAQLVAQIEYWKQQIQGMTDQLTQAQQQYQSLTGSRGMERLLSGVARNYLPPDWAALEAALRQTGGGYGALGREIDTLVRSNAVLTPQHVAMLSTVEREQLEAARRSAAMLQVTTRTALENTSQRFGALQQLINAIGSAQDPKAVLDLQARIAAEQGMLQNEQTKLLVLFQLAHAEELARKQRTREHAIAGIGSLRRLPPIGLNP